MKWMMPDLEMDPLPIDENYRAESGAKCDDQLDTASSDTSETLHVRIVSHPDRLVEPFSEFLLERKVVPTFAQIGRGIDDSIFDHAGEADRYAIKAAMIRSQLLDYF